MAFYESFYARKINSKGKVYYILKSVDLNNVESCEWLDNEHTRVCTRSGDTFIIEILHQDFTNLLISETDEYGRLFLFSDN